VKSGYISIGDWNNDRVLVKIPYSYEFLKPENKEYQNPDRTMPKKRTAIWEVSVAATTGLP
jgi:hypothetical protein